MRFRWDTSCGHVCLCTSHRGTILKHVVNCLFCDSPGARGELSLLPSCSRSEVSQRRQCASVGTPPAATSAFSARPIGGSPGARGELSLLPHCRRREVSQRRQCASVGTPPAATSVFARPIGGQVLEHVENCLLPSCSRSESATPMRFRWDTCGHVCLCTSHRGQSWSTW